jgi:hypothetical protein
MRRESESERARFKLTYALNLIPLTYIYGIPTSFVVEPACATVTSPQSEV